MPEEEKTHWCVWIFIGLLTFAACGTILAIEQGVAIIIGYFVGLFLGSLIIGVLVSWVVWIAMLVFQAIILIAALREYLKDRG
ncbi:MAG: hypothetical protein ACFFDP_05265 [Promethearchaeota archaeon]